MNVSYISVMSSLHTCYIARITVPALWIFHKYNGREGGMKKIITQMQMLRKLK